MSEKTGNTEKPEYLFNTSANLEVFIPNLKRWHRVTCNDFRSWDGKRRINEELYEGPLYAYGTNRKVINQNINNIVGSEVLDERNSRSQKLR
tara:strand:+ start:2360 stop:2635 length:276 start_codon:yes stop_codon:yes gene_type:complete